MLFRSLCAIVAKAAGAGTVIITGVREDREIRLAIAMDLGIDKIIDVTEIDLKQEVMKITSGKGVDMVVEASGSEKAIESAINLVRKNGRIVAIGETSKPEININWNAAIFKACSITFSLGTGYEAWKLALQFMKSKKINVAPLITHKLPLENFELGFKLLDEKKAVKVLLIPEEI